jgi:hypothetical protein
MIGKNTIKTLAEKLKLKVEDIEAAIKDEKEVELNLPEITVFMADELKTRDENLKRTNYESGKQAGVEILVKDLKEKTGVTIEGKDPYKFVEALKTKTLEDAKIEPNAKIQEQENIITKLKNNLQTLENENKELSSQIKENTLKGQLFSGVSKDSILPLEDVYTLMKTKGYSFDEDKGKITVKRFGEMIRDEKTQDPRNGTDVLSEFLDENNLTGQVDIEGRGKSSTKTPTKTIKTISELKKKYQSEGKSLNGSEFMAEAQKLAKDNPDFFKE